MRSKRKVVSHLAGRPGTSQRHFACQLLTAIFLLADAVGREGVGADDVGTGFDIALMNVSNSLRTRQIEHIVVSYQRDAPLCKAPTMVCLFAETQRLYQRPHGPV